MYLHNKKPLISLNYKVSSKNFLNMEMRIG